MKSLVLIVVLSVIAIGVPTGILVIDKLTGQANGAQYPEADVLASPKDDLGLFPMDAEQFVSSVQNHLDDGNLEGLKRLTNWRDVTDDLQQEVVIAFEQAIVFAGSEGGALEELVVLDDAVRKEMEAFGVTFIDDGRQRFTSPEGRPLITNHAAHYRIDLITKAEYEEGILIGHEGYSIWFGLSGNHMMFTLETPYKMPMS